MPSLQDIEDEFTAWAKDYGKIRYSFWEGDFAEEHRRNQQEALRKLEPKKGDTILDVGCGVGWGTLDAAANITPGEAHGIDITAAMLRKARHHARKVGINNVRFTKASADDMPFDDGSFDGVFTTHAAHHFPDPLEAFKEIRRVLKHGKRLVLIDTSGSTRFMQGFEEKLRKEEKSHNRFLKLSEAKALLRKAGFSNIEGYRKDHTLYVKARARRLTTPASPTHPRA